MNFKIAIPVFIAAIVLVMLFPYVVPQDEPVRIIYLNEPEILSGPNGHLFPCYDDSGNITYLFKGEEYTTDYKVKGFKDPLKCEENKDVVNRYFNNSDFVSFQYYVDKGKEQKADQHISLIKIVGNEEKVFWLEEEIPEGNYEKYFYYGDCQLSHGNQTQPVQAIIKYSPFVGQYIFICLLILLAVLLIMMFLDSWFL